MFIFIQLQIILNLTKMYSFPFAPNLANIFIHYCEQHILSNARNNWKPLIWRRFIDEIFMIWRHGEDEFKTFLEFYNQCFPTLKFTTERFLSNINFLDTIFKNKCSHLPWTSDLRGTSIFLLSSCTVILLFAQQSSSISNLRLQPTKGLNPSSSFTKDT